MNREWRSILLCHLPLTICCLFFLYFFIISLAYCKRERIVYILHIYKRKRAKNTNIVFYVSNFHSWILLWNVRLFGSFSLFVEIFVHSIQNIHISHTKYNIHSDAHDGVFSQFRFFLVFGLVLVLSICYFNNIILSAYICYHKTKLFAKSKVLTTRRWKKTQQK